MKILKNNIKSFVVFLLSLTLLFSFTACGDVTLEFSSPLDDLTDGSTSLIFVDDDRYEDDDSSPTVSDRYQTDHEDQVESPQDSNDNNEIINGILGGILNIFDGDNYTENSTSIAINAGNVENSTSQNLNNNNNNVNNNTNNNVNNNTNDNVNNTTTSNNNNNNTNDNTNNNNQNNESVVSKNNNTNVGGVGAGVATPVKLSEIPAYSGKAYCVINGGIPNFSAAELTTKSYEKYTPLDRLGRVGVAVASLSKDTMPGPNDKKDDYKKVNPTGWNQKPYEGIVSGIYLYHRCHMIAYSLCAEDETKTNLMTGTQYFNMKGMAPFEKMIREYINETGNHVAYRVTPIFSGNNLLAHGAQIEAYSIEDNGKAICFNVFCYNVQPGITINYATGASSKS